MGEICLSLVFLFVGVHDLESLSVSFQLPYLGLLLQEYLLVILNLFVILLIYLHTFDKFEFFIPFFQL